MEMFCIKENYDCWHLGWNGERQELAEQLIREAGATNDEAVRLEKYQEAQLIFAEDALIIPVCCVPETVAMRSNVTGFIQNPLGTYMFNELTLTD